MTSFSNVTSETGRYVKDSMYIVNLVAYIDIGRGLVDFSTERVIFHLPTAPSFCILTKNKTTLKCKMSYIELMRDPPLI